MSHERLTLLAETDERRYIMQCEHGVIHLTWGHMTLHLTPTDFTRVAHLLEAGVSSTAPTRTGDDRCCLVRSADGYFQLWLGNVGLHLLPVDFLLLVDMVRVALRCLTDVGSDETAADSPKTAEGDPGTEMLPGTLFSIN
ncbi:MAG: hypothetical protein ACE5I2_16625 [Anaerolineae bacterium]